MQVLGSDPSTFQMYLGSSPSTLQCLEMYLGTSPSTLQMYLKYLGTSSGTCATQPCKYQFIYYFKRNIVILSSSNIIKNIFDQFYLIYINFCVPSLMVSNFHCLFILNGFIQNGVTFLLSVYFQLIYS